MATTKKTVKKKAAPKKTVKKTTTSKAVAKKVPAKKVTMAKLPDPMPGPEETPVERSVVYSKCCSNCEHLPFDVNHVVGVLALLVVALSAAVFDLMM
ncbi:hypothetical protein ACFLZY_00365 [Patescibacteria group bacterium]